MSEISIEERVEGLIAARQRARNLISLIHATAESFEDKQKSRRFYITIAQELHIPPKGESK